MKGRTKETVCRNRLLGKQNKYPTLGVHCAQVPGHESLNKTWKLKGKDELRAV